MTAAAADLRASIDALLDAYAVVIEADTATRDADAAAQDSTIAARDATISSQASQIVGQSSQIANQANQIATQASLITSLQARIKALTPPEVLLSSAGLKDLSDGPLTAVKAGAMFGLKSKAGADSTWNNLAVVHDSEGPFVRWTTKAGSYGAGAGASAGLPLSKPVTDATLSMRIRFSPGFDPTLGGKIPGLSGVVPGVSPTFPSGGKADPDGVGWSGRIMWEKLMRLIMYMYHDGQKLTAAGVAYGDGVSWGSTGVPTGVWLNLKVRYVLNAGQVNGRLQAWLNDVSVIDVPYRYRKRDDLLITHLLFSVFRGGHEAVYAAKTDGYIDMKDFLVTTPVA